MVKTIETKAPKFLKCIGHWNIAMDRQEMPSAYCKSSDVDKIANVEN